MDAFLKDDSYITIRLEPEEPSGKTSAPETSKASEVAKAQAVPGAVVLSLADEPTRPAEPTVEDVSVVQESVSVQKAAASVEQASDRETVSVQGDSVRDEVFDREEAAEPAAVQKSEPEGAPVFELQPDPASEPNPAHEAEPETELEEEPEPIASVRPKPIPVVNQGRAPRVNPVDLSAEVDKYSGYQSAVTSSNALGIGLVALLFAIALMVVIWVGLGFISVQAKEQGAQTLRDSIMDSAMQCFAIEGYYPPSLEYLQENYGLSVNEDDYLVVYVAFASNVPPTVDVRMR